MAKKIAWTDRAKADVRGIERETAIDLLHQFPSSSRALGFPTLRDFFAKGGGSPVV